MKTEKLNLSVTATGKQQLEALGREMGLSKSELVEQVARKLIPIYPHTLSEEVKQSLKKPYNWQFNRVRRS